MSAPETSSPSPSRRPLWRRIAIVALGVLAVAAGVAVAVGSYYYRRYGPVPMCETVPVKGEPVVSVFRLTDPDAPNWLGSKAHLACPEAGRSFVEWYAWRIYLDGHFIDAILESRESDQSWGFAGFGLWSADPIRPLEPHFAQGKDIVWPEQGLDASMMTRSHAGKREKSFARLLQDGPQAGKIEVRLVSRNADLHFFATPLSPGYRRHQVGDDRTRPGTWIQYLCVFSLGRAEGQLTIYDRKGTPSVYPLKGPDSGPPIVYMEHMWGQADRPRSDLPNRYYWDWGTWGKIGAREAVLCEQVDHINTGVDSSAGFFMGMDTAYTFAHDPPRQATRMVYRRLEPVAGMLYPQEFHLFARASDSPAYINMQGFVRSDRYDWQAFDLFGRAGDGSRLLDWDNDPVWSVMDFYKGVQVREILPRPAQKFLVREDKDGIRLSWKKGDPTEDELEFWVFRVEGPDRLDPGIPIGMLVETAQGPEAAKGVSPGPDGRDEMEFIDPQGSRNSVYKVVSVISPPTLLHRRFMAGYTRCSKPAEVMPPPVAAPGELGPALDPSAAADFAGAAGRELALPDSSPAARLRLVRDPATNALEFDLETKDAGKWVKAAALRPRFSPRTQVESFSAVSLGPGRVALAWSERTPIMNGASYTDWEIFAAVNDVGAGTFRLADVSMSDFDSVAVGLEGHEDKLIVSWLECTEGFCIPARQEMEPAGP